jgi:hypothetical protein
MFDDVLDKTMGLMVTDTDKKKTYTLLDFKSKIVSGTGKEFVLSFQLYLSQMTNRMPTFFLYKAQ